MHGRVHRRKSAHLKLECQIQGGNQLFLRFGRHCCFWFAWISSQFPASATTVIPNHVCDLFFFFFLLEAFRIFHLSLVFCFGNFSDVSSCCPSPPFFYWAFSGLFNLKTCVLQFWIILHYFFDF